MEQSQEGNTNAKCKAQKHKLTSKAQKEALSATLRIKPKKHNTKRTMPKNHNPWETIMPKNKAEKPRCLRKHGA